MRPRSCAQAHAPSAPNGIPPPSHIVYHSTSCASLQARQWLAGIARGAPGKLGNVPADSPRNNQRSRNIRCNAMAAHGTVFAGERNGVFHKGIGRIDHHGHLLFGSRLGVKTHCRILEIFDFRASLDAVVAGPHFAARGFGAVGLLDEYPAFPVPCARHRVGRASAIENGLESHSRAPLVEPQPQRHGRVGVIAEKEDPLRIVQRTPSGCESSARGGQRRRCTRIVSTNRIAVAANHSLACRWREAARPAGSGSSCTPTMPARRNSSREPA